MIPTKEEAYKIIASLVERFEEQLPSYKQGAYNETLTRRDFIDPFFKALGWDMDNSNGYAEAYREVIHEDKLKIGSATKAPDYSFRLSGGKRLFFVEAKKPSVVVKDDILPAYQVRRYGWSAKMPISIITDFEEFSVYDCTKKPLPADKASVARIRYITYREYLKEFDFIWDTFSKERVLKGSFDKFVQSDTYKKGTATVDKEFLHSLDQWRTYLATSISWRNKELNEDEINFAVQQTLDRIIFLRIAEDRGVEPYGSLKNAVKSGDHYQNLFAQFCVADDKYNSGLFDFVRDKISRSLQVDNKVIKTIINELYYPESPYEFSVLSVEILGSTYEQFLGKQIKIDKAHRAHIEEKPEVRKAGGVYYTPQYIVDYIVKNTVGKLAENKTPEEVSKFKIVDPACGSGSFLIGAYQYLLDWYKDHYSFHLLTRKKRAEVLTPEGNLTAAEKKRILLNNIYGVDIDVNAVEVTKLSLLLKCMEGETKASIEHQVSMFNERVLPSLENNIKCGNSLIDTDYYDNQLDFGEEKKIKPFNWQKAFPDVFKQGGFDAVIGNPPYVRQELLGEQKDYYKQKYKVYHGMADLYSYFIEKSINLLNENGIYGVIVANKWMRANYGEPLRKFLKLQNIEEIIDFGDLPVFETATTYPCILIVNKNKKTDEIKITIPDTLKFSSLSEYVKVKSKNIKKETLNQNVWHLGVENIYLIIEKIKTKGVTLRSYVNDQLYRGILTGYNKAFVINNDVKNLLISEDPNSSEIIKPFLVGKDIRRYAPPFSDKYIIFTRRGININQYPAIKKYLSQFRKQLEPKSPDFNGLKWEGRKPGKYKWFEIQDSTEYYNEFEKVKILWPGISSEVTSFTLDKNKYYGNDNNQLIITDDKYLLGILNSRITKFQLLNICDKVQGGFYRLKMTYIKQLIIKVSSTQIELKLKNEIIKLVDQLLKLNEELQNVKLQTQRDQIQNKIDYCENRINKIVYELYGLSEEEIKIVEGV